MEDTQPLRTPHTFQYSPTETRAPFTFACIGCSDEVPNWSLDQLTLRGNAPYDLKLNAALRKFGITHAYVPPTSKFNAVVLQPNEFTSPLRLENMMVWRSRRKHAEGTLLYEPNQAVIFSPGGCPIVVVTRGEKMAVVHAGEKSLFDYTLLANSIRSSDRPHTSVVDSVLEALQVRSELHAKELQVWIFYSIDSVRYFHPLMDRVHTQYNRALWKHLQKSPYAASECLQVHPNGDMHLNLPAIISRQFTAQGVPWTQVYMGFSGLPINDQLYPTTRAARPEDRSRRYLIAVIRN